VCSSKTNCYRIFFNWLGNYLTNVSIPAGTVLDDTTAVLVFLNSDGFLDSLGDLNNIGLFVDLILLSGETSFLGGNRITLTFEYPDANDDGVVDGFGIPEEFLLVYWFDGSLWHSLDDSVCDQHLNKCVATTDHLTVFALLGNGTSFVENWGSY